MQNEIMVDHMQANLIRGVLRYIEAEFGYQTLIRLAEDIVGSTSCFDEVSPDLASIMKFLNGANNGLKHPNLCILPCVLFIRIRHKEIYRRMSSKKTTDLYALLYLESIYKEKFEFRDDTDLLQAPVNGLSQIADAISDSGFKKPFPLVMQLLRPSLDPQPQGYKDADVICEILMLDFQNRECVHVSFKGKIYRGIIIQNERGEVRLLMMRRSPSVGMLTRSITTGFSPRSWHTWFSHFNKFGDATLRSINSDCYLIPFAEEKLDKKLGDLPYHQVIKEITEELNDYMYSSEQQIRQDSLIRSFLCTYLDDKRTLDQDSSVRPGGALHGRNIDDVAFLKEAKPLLEQYGLFKKPSITPSTETTQTLNNRIEWSLIIHEESWSNSLSRLKE